jgi:TonB-linked SusC/RagA family outer membrane protein
MLVAQELTGEIRGTVRDRATGEALIGANVLIMGTTRGTSTNSEGAFILRGLAPGSYTIQVQFVGYVRAQQTVVVAAGRTVETNFNLQQDVLRIDEVVVTGISGEIPRAELGHSISKVSGDVIGKVVTTNVLDALAAKAPGIQVTRSTGAPGAGVYITIRGRHTITGTSQPLYVVDGMPIDNTTAGIGGVPHANRAVDINPNDIESIEILKGASAAAIYGSRAANGVVLITTKSGKQAAPGRYARITYSTSYTSEDLPTSWPLQRKYGQTTPYRPYAPGSTTSWPAFPLPAGGLPGGGNRPLPADTPTYDQSRAIFETGRMLENTLSVSGGNPLFRYLVSGTHFDHQGIIVNSDLERTSLRANLNMTLLENLSVTSNSNFIRSIVNNTQDGSNVAGLLLSALRAPPEFDQTRYLEDDGITQRRYAIAYDNPIWSAKFVTNRTTLSRFIHSTGFEYDAFMGLRISGKVGLDRYEQGFFQRHANQSAGVTGRVGGVSQARVTNSLINTELVLVGKQKLTEDFLATLILGQQLRFDLRNTTSAGSTTTLPFFNEIPAGAVPSSSSSRTENRHFGYFGEATLGMWERLTLRGSLRYDGSSTFGDEQRWFWYPKASLSYRLSEESFIKNLGLVDELKLRAAWGVSGLQPGAYVTNYTYTTLGNFDPWGRGTTQNRLGQSGLRHSVSAGNPRLKPEKTTELETGIDLAFWNRRVNFEFSYYRQDITDLLLFVPVPWSTGFNSQIRNAGAMEKTGFEAKLEIAPPISDDIQWILGFTYAQNETKVTKLEGVAADGFISLAGGFAGILNTAQVGKPLGIYRGVGWERDANRNIVYSNPAAGIADNVLGGNIRNAPRWAEGLIVIGDPNPKWTGSVRSDLTLFRDLTISALFDIVWDFDVWNGTNGALFNFGTAKETEDREDYWFNERGAPVIWEGPGNRTIGTRRYAPGDTLRKEVWYRVYAMGFNNNEPHIEDGSFVKLRDVSVSYRLRSVPFFNLESIAFTFSARNLKTWTKYKGYDPEINHFNQAEGRGYDYFNLPQVRSYRFGISIHY